MLYRLLAVCLLAGFGLTVAAPLAVAHPHTAAAQMARVHAVGPVEAAVAKALEAAASSPNDAGAFQEALLAALEAHPEGEALAEYLASSEAPDALLDLLLGQLLRSKSLPLPNLVAMAAASSTAPVGASGDRVLLALNTDSEQAKAAGVLGEAATLDAVIVPLAVLSAAQPLGP
jgi:hypothetical protein